MLHPGGRWWRRQDVPGGVADQASSHSLGRRPGTHSLRPDDNREGLAMPHRSRGKDWKGKMNLRG